MSDQDQIQPGQNQDDELDVEELEDASGGALAPDADDANGVGCNGNCGC